MKKKLFYLLLVGILLFPCNVLAYTTDEAVDIFDKISGTTDGEGNRTLILDSLSPNVLDSAGTCEYSKERLLDECPDCYEGYTDEDWENEIKNTEAVCLDEFVISAAKLHMVGVGITLDERISVSVEEGLLVVGVKTGEDSNGNDVFVHTDFRVSYELADHEDREDAHKVAAAFKNSYTLSGPAVINLVYNYGNVHNYFMKNNNLLYGYEHAKNLMTTNNKYEYRFILRGAGSTPTGSGCDLMIGIYSDGALLAVKSVGVGIQTVLTVDKDAEGTPYEKVIKLLSEYLGDGVKVSVDTDSYEVLEDDEYLNYSLNSSLGTEDVKYTAYVATYKIGESEQVFTAVEVAKDKATADELVITAENADTNVMIETESFDVPVDVVVETRDVSKDEKVIEAATKNNLIFGQVFDIKLYSKLDDKSITDISKGVTVYVPVTNLYFVGGTVDVYYINDDGEVEETIPGQVVEVNGKLYVKFVVKHFSVYAIQAMDPSVPSESVPGTGDAIALSMILAGLSFAGIVILKKKQLI